MPADEVNTSSIEVPIGLEPSRGFTPQQDQRRHVPQPPPVRLVAVEDVRLVAMAGVEAELDAFYVDLLRFERDLKSNHQVRYLAENAAVVFNMVERPPERPTLRPLGIEVPSLTGIEHQLIEREQEFTRQKSLSPGQESLLILDPAGNWIEVTEIRGL